MVFMKGKLPIHPFFFFRDYPASVLYNPVHKKYRKVSDHKNERKKCETYI